MNTDDLKNKPPVVGQKVWVCSSAPWSRRTCELFEATVSKVGRKYFFLTERPREKYDLKTLSQVTKRSYKNKIYIKKQDFFDKQESQKLFDEIKQAFNGKLQYSLPQLREIAEIIGLQTPSPAIKRADQGQVFEGKERIELKLPISICTLAKLIAAFEDSHNFEDSHKECAE